MAGQIDSSFTPNYFSIQDILASQERVPCVAATELADIGFLDPGSDRSNLPAGTKLELPYWVVEGLRVGRQPLVNMQLPKTYKETYREILLADSNVVDLHKLGPHFYEFGRYLMKHSPVEGELIGTSISQTFKSRFLNMLDAAQNCRDTEVIKEMSKMDNLERELFKKAYKKRKETDGWMLRQVYQLNTSCIVNNVNKRTAKQ